MKKLALILALALVATATFAAGPNPTADPVLYSAATQRGYAETKNFRYNLFYGPMGLNSPLWIGEPSTGSSLDSLLFLDTEPTGVEYSVYSASTLPTVLNGDLTVATEVTGGDNGAENNIKGNFGIGLAAVVGTNGTTETTLYVDDSPAGEWTAVDASVVVSADTVHKKIGSNSLKLAFAAGAAAADGAIGEITNDDLEANESIGFWVYSDTALTAGDLTLVIDDTDASPDLALDFPAVTAGAWQWVEIDISALTGGNGNVTDKVKILLSTAGATNLGAFNVQFDGMYKWDATDESTLGDSVIMDGVHGAITLVTTDAGATAHTLGNLSVYTAYFVNYQSGNEVLVWINDQSANQVLVLYSRQ